ncbi:precorrin-6A synthase (deacetylating) [Amaricoccus solimangrovi]|uniref:Precorrin-6A synthase [deacetylating] n=1 Tax=Amaricoccus solimangrovi TaxID=2589815 RepID=A0A501WY68_9RHOB|nr:precorrin-6A synthase (deacetylating) [Amaricoccus solimangrovi]TPE53490.1 precorrin-6A synthase (deacetylating) [Amaricoccus solimangrovi]
MRDLFLIGIGSGDPEHLTLAAVRRLREADLVLIPRKGAEKADLAGLRRAIRDAHAPGIATAEFDLPRRDAARPDYRAGVDAWHAEIAAAWQAALLPHPEARRIALLVWGDPSLYDSTPRIARLAGGFRVTVVPGLTAPQLLTAGHAIPLNAVGAPVLVTTGRRLRDEGWPADAPDTVVVMLDGDCVFQGLDPADVSIWWGAFLGMPEQILRAGPLATAGPEIVALRAEARARHGWIMDTYILRRGADRDA